MREYPPFPEETEPRTEKKCRRCKNYYTIDIEQDADMCYECMVDHIHELEALVCECDDRAQCGDIDGLSDEFRERLEAAARKGWKMTESNYLKKSNSWTPKKLAEHKVWVTPGTRRGRLENVYVFWEGMPDFGVEIERIDGEGDGDWIARAYAEATRVAKDREAESKEVKVWWVSSNPYDQVVTSEPCMNNDVPLVLADDHRRSVGETPKQRIGVLKFVIDNPHASPWHETAKKWLAEIESANAAIKAAREAK